MGRRKKIDLTARTGGRKRKKFRFEPQGREDAKEKSLDLTAKTGGRKKVNFKNLRPCVFAVKLTHVFAV